MSGPIYPASDLDVPERLLDLLGTFWANTYQGADLVQSILHARGRLEQQTFDDLFDLVAATSRYQVPVFHIDHWYQLTLRESQRDSVATSALPRFDATRNVGGENFRFDIPIPDLFASYPLPAGLRDVAVIMNRISAPSVTLIRGADYVLDIEKVTITFLNDPFANPLIPTQPVWQGDQIVDQEISLWLFRARFEQRTLHEQFGYVLQVDAPSSPEYRDLINASFDGLIRGPGQKPIQQAFSAITGIPLVRETTETVEDIFSDSRGLCVITDRHAYRFSRDAMPIVAIGDRLLAGAPLTDGLLFYEFNRGQTPGPSEVSALALGAGVLAAGYYQELVFSNADTPLVVEPDVDGFTKISFAVSGFPGDVAKFWDDLHAKGVARGQTLANLLDRRTNKVGQPTAASLPATINPLQFLCENVFRDNAFLVRIRPDSAGPGALGLAFGRVFRKLIPPQTLLLVLVELVITDDPVILDGPGSPERPGCTEVLSSFTGGTLHESLPLNLIVTNLRARQIVGRCE